MAQKKNKANKNLIIGLSVALGVAIVAIIVIVILINQPDKGKEYISPEELTQNTKIQRENAIADEVEAYADSWMANHRGKCPESLNDFLNKTDVLTDMKLIRESDNQCKITYTNYAGQTTTIRLRGN